jgi:hypothetical protein
MYGYWYCSAASIARRTWIHVHQHVPLDHCSSSPAFRPSKWKSLALVRSLCCWRMLAQGNARAAGDRSHCWITPLIHASPAETEGDPQSSENSFTDDTRCQPASPAWTEGAPQSPGNSSCSHHGRSRCWKTFVLLGDTSVAEERSRCWETLAFLGNEGSRCLGNDCVAGNRSRCWKTLALLRDARVAGEPIVQGRRWPRPHGSLCNRCINAGHPRHPSKPA